MARRLHPEEKLHRYIRLAAQAREVAEQVQDPARRLALQRWAEAYERLAAQETRDHELHP